MSIVFNTESSESFTKQVKRHSIVKQRADSNNQMIQAVFEASTDAVIGIDSAGYIRYWNHQSKQMFNFPLHILKGKHCSDLFINDKNECPEGCKAQCSINRRHHPVSQRTGFDAEIIQAKGKRLNVSIGSCHILQEDPQFPCTYFSLRKKEARDNSNVLEKALTGSNKNEFNQLTRRQQQVLTLAVEGLSTNEIADKMSVGLETVRSHFRQVYSKLGVRSRVEAVSLCLRTAYD